MNVERKVKTNIGVISARVGIADRQEIVSKRFRIRNIEVDLMMGKEYKSALLVMTDRATLKTMIEKLSGKKADKVYEIIKTS